MAKKNLKYKDGDIVMFIGDTCYKTSFSRKPIKCSSGSAIVEKTSLTAPHSYFLRAPEGSDSDVYGWVNIRDVQAIKEEPEDELKYHETEEDSTWEEMEIIEIEEKPAAEASEEETQPFILASIQANLVRDESKTLKYKLGANEPFKCIMKNSSCYLNKKEMMPRGIIWHSTGINEPMLSNFVQPRKEDEDYQMIIEKLGRNEYGNDYNHTEKRDGTHYWIGKDLFDNVIAVQTLPNIYKAWSCGTGLYGTLNNGWIQINLCEDNLDDVFYFQRVYEEACQLTAYLCDCYKIDPIGITYYKDLGLVKAIEVPTILCHQDAADLGLATNRVDVYHWFSKYGITMDDARKRISKLTKPLSYNLNAVDGTSYLFLIPEEPKEEIEEKIEDKEG